MHGLTKEYCGTLLSNINWTISNPTPWQPQTLTTRNLCKMGRWGTFLIIFVARACWPLFCNVAQFIWILKDVWNRTKRDANASRCATTLAAHIIETNSATANRSRYNGWQKTFLSHRAHQMFTINVSYQILKIETTSLCFFSKSQACSTVMGITSTFSI